MQADSTQKPQLDQILMLPVRRVPEQFNPFILNPKDIECRFVNDYQNVLIKDKTDSRIFWALKPHPDCCAQVFCHLLKPGVDEQALLKLNDSENSEEKPAAFTLCKVSDQVFLAQINQRNSQQLGEKDPLTAESVESLLEQVQEIGKNLKVPLNLFKGSFESFQAYSSCSPIKYLTELEDKIQESQSDSEQIPSATQTLLEEKLVEKLNSKNINRVPKCDMQTGEWDSAVTIDVKLVQ